MDRNYLLTTALTTAALFFGAGAATAGTMDSSVNIQNNSSWEIHQIYVAPIDTTDWGDNLLKGDVVEAEGGSVEIFKIACDTYDVRLVDEDGAECIVPDISLCAERDAWVVEDEDLLACQAAT